MMTVLLITIAFVLVTYLFGFIYAAVSGANKRSLIAVLGWTGFSVLGFIGVPFHELSHLVAALAFNHDITGFELFRPIKGKADGQLGYVNHSYNKGSLYQSAGNFFIGAAPMIFGAGLLTLLLTKTVILQINVSLSFSPEACFNYFKIIGLQFLQSLISGDIFAVLTVLTAFLICPHLGMSGADFKNTTTGVIFLLAASVTVPHIISGNTGISYDIISGVLLYALINYVYALIVGLVISIIVLLLVKLLDIIL